MKLRPFTTANDFRTRTRKQKGIGNNMMDTYLDVVTGMGEVDKVLNECEEIGRQLSYTMRIWAHGAAASAVNASTKPGASGDQEVGLDLVAISEETIRTQVETSNNPDVREAFKDYIRTQPAGVPSTVTLKDYQMLGVNWLNLLYRRGTSCILADEMGERSVSPRPLADLTFLTLSARTRSREDGTSHRFARSPQGDWRTWTSPCHRPFVDARELDAGILRVCTRPHRSQLLRLTSGARRDPTRAAKPRGAQCCRDDVQHRDRLAR